MYKKINNEYFGIGRFEYNDLGIVTSFAAIFFPVTSTMFEFFLVNHFGKLSMLTFFHTCYKILYYSYHHNNKIKKLTKNTYYDVTLQHQSHRHNTIRQRYRLLFDLPDGTSTRSPHILGNQVFSHPDIVKRIITRQFVNIGKVNHRNESFDAFAPKTTVEVHWSVELCPGYSQGAGHGNCLSV